MTPTTMNNSNNSRSETVLEINLDALTHNFNFLTSKINSDHVFMGVVKANAYGSDAIIIAKELEKLGADYLAVAYSKEGIELREAGIELPIMVLHPLPANFDILVTYKLEPAIYSVNILNHFLRFLEDDDVQHYPIHLKINTGLNRLGFKPNQTQEIIGLISENKSVKIHSIFSHLVASEDQNETELTQTQIRQLEETASVISESLGYRPMLHCSNTASMVKYSQEQFDMVRVGMGLYGYTYDSEINQQLRPVTTLKTVISQMHHLQPGDSVGYNRGFIANKPIKSATLPVGHADGIPRKLGKGKGWVVINGQKAHIIGNVCMDMIMVDVSEILCEEGQEVIVFGENNPADMLAEAADTITYELISGISSRIERKIIRDN